MRTAGEGAAGGRSEKTTGSSRPGLDVLPSGPLTKMAAEEVDEAAAAEIDGQGGDR